MFFFCSTPTVSRGSPYVSVCPRHHESRCSGFFPKHSPLPSKLPSKTREHSLKRFSPTAHASSNHGSCHGDAFAAPPRKTRTLPQPYDSTGPFPLLATLRRIYARIQSLRDNLPVAVFSMLCLVLAGILKIARVVPIFIKPLQGVCFLLAGTPAILASATRLLRTGVNVDVLMTLAAIASIITGSVFEGCLLMALYALSHAGEKFVVGRARGDLDSLTELIPATVLRVFADNGNGSDEGLWENGRAVEVPLDDVGVGDVVLVKGGEIVPCDGVVVKGTAFVTSEHITGESTPRAVEVGDEVPAGARSVDDAMYIKVSAVGSESSVARIAKLVTVAQEHRPRVSRFFDRFGQTYGRIVLFVSFALATLLPAVAVLFGRQPIPFYGSGGSLKRSLGFLVAASPCALVIGAPVAYLSTLSACARRGVLVKGGAKAVEAVAAADRVVFDKTGTLTTGNLKLSSTFVLEPSSQVLKKASEEQLEYALSIATALGSGAVHPISRALEAESLGHGVTPCSTTTLKIVAGYGVEGMVKMNGSSFFASIGRAQFVLKHYLEGTRGAVLKKAADATTVTMLAVKDAIYVFNFVDELRPEAPATVRQLEKDRLATVVLTGDGKTAAQTMAKALGPIGDVYSELNPEQKLQYVESWSSSQNLLMVGDGINDAPALAAATAGVACGLSSATAVHAADVVLVKSDLTDLPWLVRKARATEKVVKQNIVLALAFMALGLLPSLAGALPLWLVVTLHEGGTFVVGLNGLRLLSDRLS